MAVQRDGDAWTVVADHEVRYAVEVVDGLFDVDNDRAVFGLPAGAGRDRLVVVDATVAEPEMYGDLIRRWFDARGIGIRMVEVAGGEENKSLDLVQEILAAMVHARVPRRGEPVIAIGGGVVLDAVGMAAGLYRRGVPWVRVPTTLVGMIDAGIGAKTGVDFLGGKNKLGSFHPAERALIDPAFLFSVPRRRIADGMAEIVKVGVMRDLWLFELMEQYGWAHLDMTFRPGGGELHEAGREILTRAIDGMLVELERDLFETGDLRRAMDFGHTWGPAIEMAALPELLHGESVALDMALSTVIATRRGLLSETDAQRVFALLRGLELPTWHAVMTPEVLGGALAEAVRHRGAQHVPLPDGLGGVTFVGDVADDEVLDALAELRALQMGEGQ